MNSFVQFWSKWQKSFSQTETPQLFNFVLIIFCFVLMEVLQDYFQYLFLKHESVGYNEYSLYVFIRDIKKV